MSDTVEQAAEKTAQAFVGKDYSQAVMPQNRVVLQGLDSGDFVALGLGTADVSDSDGTVEFIRECAAEHILSAITSATEALQQENAELRNRLLNGDHDLMTLAECQERHREAGTHPTPCQICDGGLAYCKRCHGGEAELQESCADRLAKQNAELREQVADLDLENTRLAVKIGLVEVENTTFRNQLAECRRDRLLKVMRHFQETFAPEKRAWVTKELRRMAEQPAEAPEKQGDETGKTLRSLEDASDRIDAAHARDDEDRTEQKGESDGKANRQAQ